MAELVIRDFGFAYSGGSAQAAGGSQAPDKTSLGNPAGEHTGLSAGALVLSHVDLTVSAGSFCVLVGPTGSGKSTLLRSVKPELALAGERTGQVLIGRAAAGEDCQDGVACDPFAHNFQGSSFAQTLNESLTDVTNLSARESAGLIGFVMQDPDQQIVCDQVWHEIAFGCENLGMPAPLMRRRVAEVCHFLGIAPWVNQQVETLSGGQKQLVNLASVLTLRPEIILLDEPTSMLDPVGRTQFLAMLSRVNRELGITVVMATHAPWQVATYATQLVELVPAEQGGCTVRSSEVDAALRSQMAVDPTLGLLGVPGEGAGATCDDAATYGEESLSNGAAAGDADSFANRSQRQESAQDVDAALELQDAFFRYGRDAQWVLRGMNLHVMRGSVHAVVGGNGSGKSTLLKVLSGILPLKRGRVRNQLAGAQAYLPQSPQLLFACDTATDELMEWSSNAGYGLSEAEVMLTRLGLERCAGLSPFDLSGGQQQLLALGKLLLTKPQLLFADEPSKGLDLQAKVQLAAQFRELKRRGCTIVLVTHDLAFARAVADKVTMVFDGQDAATDDCADFFRDNLFYTV